MPVGFGIQEKRLKLDDQCAIQKVPHAGRGSTKKATKSDLREKGCNQKLM